MLAGLPVLLCGAMEYASQGNGATRLSGRCRSYRLEKVKHWRKEQLVFVNSMSDLFHPDVPFEFIDKVMIVIKKYPQHTFKILTKRVKRMAQFFSAWQDYPYPDNIHHGVSICTQSEADEKIPILLSIPSAFRFVSFEPLLEYIDIVKKPWYGDWDAYNAIGWLEQIIIGCERRISNVAGRGQDVFIEAAESLIEQADKADVKVHVKQVPIDGKVETDIKKFPKELQRRDTP